MNRNTIELLIKTCGFSPVFYGLIAYYMDGKDFAGSVWTMTMKSFFLLAALAILLGSRPVEWFLLTKNIKNEKPSISKVRIAMIILSLMIETISVIGAVAVAIGAKFNDAVPFFLLGALAFIDFRLFRFPALLSLIPEDDGFV